MFLKIQDHPQKSIVRTEAFSLCIQRNHRETLLPNGIWPLPNGPQEGSPCHGIQKEAKGHHFTCSPSLLMFALESSHHPVQCLAEWVLKNMRQIKERQSKDFSL